ncbi:MAG: hypothetical protein ABI432_07720 [Flavobacteriales bacterium]
MERREQYDPEDIESLLNERSFDELLEEERAYVLRHLASRDEYENMRVLLHQVRSDERNEGPIIAPAEVRAHVLDVFRQQQQPQWRVWLNSIGAVLWPKEMSALWRPALALGSLALLITAGVFVLRQGDESKAQLAELRPAKEEVTTIKPDPASAQQAAPAFDSVLNDRRSSQMKASEDVHALEQGTFEKEDQSGYVRAVPPTAGATAAAAERSYTTVSGSTAATFDAVSVAPAVESLEEEKAAVVDDERLAKKEEPASVPHQVTEVELARNESVANATGRARTVSKRKTMGSSVSASSRSLGDDAALVSLINSGW